MKCIGTLIKKSGHYYMKVTVSAYLFYLHVPVSFLPNPFIWANLLVQLGARRNPVVHPQKIQSLFSIFLMNRGDQHTAGINAMRKVFSFSDSTNKLHIFFLFQDIQPFSQPLHIDSAFPHSSIDCNSLCRNLSLADFIFLI